MRWSRLHVVMAAALLIQSLPAAPAQRSLPWNELGRVVTAKRVSLEVDRVRIEGQALEVSGDALVIDVRKTSDTAVPKGRRTVPRQSVVLLRLIEHRSPFRVVAAVLLPVGVAYVATSAGFDEDTVNSEKKFFAGMLAMLIGSIVGGYYLGRAIDRSTTEITIAADGST